MTASALDALRRAPAFAYVRPLAQRLELVAWHLSGRPVPVPHLLKQRLVAAHARRFGRRVLVETGTYLGTMVRAQLGLFEEIVSIEIDPALCARARTLFASRPHVRILEGDSGTRLAEVVSSRTRPALFWLDAHDSGGFTARGPRATPIAEELACVLSGPRDPVVLIDDAHLFDGRGDWPTATWVRERGEAAGLSFRVDANVMRLTPEPFDV